MCNIDKGFIPKISIIIPMYNSETFLKKCLDSVIVQTMKSFEIIIIDDKSTDRSLKIANEYTDKFNYIKIVNLQKNNGVSFARNIGLEHARGEYIFFLDSDDFIESNFLEVMYKNIKKCNADIACCKYYYIKEKGKKNSNKKIYIRKCLFNHRPGKYNSVNIIGTLIKDTNLHFFLWNKIFKRDIILQNNLFFENKCFEDMIFTLKAFYFSHKIVIIDDFLYYYRKHNFSLTNSMSFDQLNSYLHSLKLIKSFLIEKDIYKIYKFSYIYLALRFFISCLYRVPQALYSDLKKRRVSIPKT